MVTGSVASGRRECEDPSGYQGFAGEDGSQHQQRVSGRGVHHGERGAS